MPTINELLSGLGVEGSEQEKTASQNDSGSESAVEQKARELGLINDNVKDNVKTASQNGGSKMDLNDLYNSYFQESTEKTASEYTEQVKTASDEEIGEMAGQSFAEGLNERLIDFSIKLAAAEDSVLESEATKEIQSGENVIPGTETKTPILKGNKNRHGHADDTKIDTDPQYYDLKSMDGAMAKAKLEAQLATNNVEDVSHTNKHVDTGAEEPVTQKTASRRMSDLSREELLILNTNYDEGIMKEARAAVYEELEKVAELEGVAEESYNFGADLAMQKIAEMEEKAKKKEEKDDDEDEDEDESEKTASAMGKFILEGYWNTMMEKGAEYYGKEHSQIYLEELVKEAKLQNIGKAAKKYYKKGMSQAKKGLKKGKQEAKKHVGKAMGGSAAGGAGVGFMAGRSGKD